jgi:hypothetical protein
MEDAIRAVAPNSTVDPSWEDGAQVFLSCVAELVAIEQVNDLGMHPVLALA